MAGISDMNISVGLTDTEFRKGLKKVNKQVRGLNRQIGNIASAGGLLLGASLFVNLAKDASQLAQEAKGVEFAFNRIAGSIDTLEDARTQTQGLLSDLDIKKSIVEFDNFGLSTEKIGTLLKFVSVTATQTGKSFDIMRNSLIEGLSKESKLRIDNLGISQMALNAELEKTPNFLEAVANIAERKVAAAGDILEEAGSQTAQFSASIIDLKVELGTLVNDLLEAATPALREFVDIISNNLSVWKGISNGDITIGKAILVDPKQFKEGKTLVDEATRSLKGFSKEALVASNPKVLDAFEKLTEGYQKMSNTSEKAREKGVELFLQIKAGAKTAKEMADAEKLLNAEKNKKVELTDKEIKALERLQKARKSGREQEVKDMWRVYVLGVKLGRKPVDLTTTGDQKPGMEGVKFDREIAPGRARVSEVAGIETLAEQYDLTLNLDRALDDLGNAYERLNRRMKEGQEFQDVFAASTVELGIILENLIATGAVDIFAGLFEGGDAAKEALVSMLDGIMGALADYMKGLAKALILSSKAAAAFKSIFANPVLGLIAGAALFAGALVVKGIFAKGPKDMKSGGLLGGETIVRAGEYPGASSNPEVFAPLNTLTGHIVSAIDKSGGGGNVVGVVRVKGSDLEIVMGRRGKISKRVQP